ncbi:hypothetical protein CONPUDRAFT_83860 [Coniophora puteana RWD-64-598 SS2]|uniref:DUF6699 domain-containing protein n=1 Tax=Coniophora puteana (strain RWD-64-598) TaxID=741705 RepID=A0A5M3MGW2_CONPW|nr:uncharacterized protein CONPUDRAFT_83860 [Coniophora puteana RWD-64-598 SS2]EIW78469.1 hypothetical protein CONPUDRAFT_83860 [Coniophora puteana RWD-64-598 SS2]
MPGRVHFTAVNPLLAFTPDTHKFSALQLHTPCAISWDVRDPPRKAEVVLDATPSSSSSTSASSSSSSSTSSGPRSLTNAELSQHATHPPVRALRLTCGLLAPDWLVVATASSSCDGVTVGDVLMAIHDALVQRVGQREWKQLMPKASKRIARVFYARCGSAPGEVEQAREYFGGVKRVDWLLNATAFAGLTCLESDSGEPEAVITLKKAWS